MLFPSDNAELKQRIARFAAGFIEDGDTIFMNSSSTVLEILDYIGDKNIVVVTNNGKILEKELPFNIEVVLTGGQVYGRKQSMVGDFATHVLNYVTASKAFLGVSGIAEEGISTVVFQESLINREMISRSAGPVFIVTDSTKVGKKNNFSSGEISGISYLITDTHIQPEYTQTFEKSGIIVMKVE